MTAGAFLCVLRARFFRFEVRLLGTAMVVESCWWFGVRRARGRCSENYRDETLSFFSASHRGSAVCVAHS